MRKQFILLMTDTTRKDMLGIYGNKEMITPNLDNLAKSGIRYEKAYSCQPVCGPARSAIFTGIFPHSNGMVANSLPLGANVKTLGNRLSDNGIESCYIGKYHLDGGDYFGLGICPDGWDKKYWYDMRCYLGELTKEERVKSRLSSTAYENWEEGMCFAHRVVDRALDFIKENKDRDFFLVVSLDEPHGPCLCPPEFVKLYKGFSFSDNPGFHDKLDKKPLMQKLWAGDALNLPDDNLNKSSEMLSLFLSCNTYADYELGRVIDLIDKTIPDAMVIYTSDHGDMLGSHRLQGKNAAFYEEITNIPLIIRDGQNGRKGVDFNPTSHIDIAPTVLEYFGIPRPKLFEGKSMLPAIKDNKIKTNNYVFSEFTRYEVDHDGFGGLQMMRSITDGRYKLSLNLMDTDEFYDTKEDPHEVVNLIENDEYKEIRNTLHDTLVLHMDNTRDPYRGYQWVVRTWRPESKASWNNSAYTRQRENEEYEPRQLDYDTGLEMEEAVRSKRLYDEKR